MTYSNNMVFNSYVISYLGQFVLNENAQHFDSIHLYNSGVVGFGINMICALVSLVLISNKVLRPISISKPLWKNYHY